MATAVLSRRVRSSATSASGVSPVPVDHVADEASYFGSDVPKLSPAMQLVRGVLVLLFVLSAGMLLELAVVSRLQASAAQGRLFDRFRAQLAVGTAPIGPKDANDKVIVLGTPIAYIEIPSIDLKQVILQGTTSGVLFDGPGHRRDTPFPGQIGSSVIYGRHFAFGGPFSDIGDLKNGAAIKVTTGQGSFEYHVIGVRKEGDPAPAPLKSGSARLQLVTADGSPYLPSGVLRVDADIVGTPAVGPQLLISKSALPSEEQAMAGDTRTLWVLALWLQALVLLTVALAWAWHRWGRAQAWICLVPVMLLVGLAASGELVRILPNLL
jgi:sortase A